MIFYWLAVFFFSTLGMFVFPVYGAVTSPVWLVMLLAGLVAAVCGSYRKPLIDIPEINNATVSMLLASIALGLAVFQFPYSLALYLLGIGVLVQRIAGGKWTRSLANALIVSGLVIAVQDVLMVPYMKVAARYHEAGCFTPLFYLLFKGLGLECAFSQNTIFVQTPREVVSLVTTWEKLGLYFAVVYGAGALVLISLWQSSRSCFEKFVAVVKLLIVLLLYIVARYVALAVMVVDFGRVELFWEPWMVACSWLPLVFLISKAVPGGVQRQVGLLQICCNRKNMYAGAAAGIFCLSLVGYGWFPDPGAEKQGRILIDEYYSDWEWTERPLDTRWYGIQSVYNYHNMGEYLRYFFKVDTLKQPVSEEVLERCDVFMVKTPTRAFSRKEIDTIVAFARRGGGVFLIGDHTNVFGTTININPLAHEFGIRFNYDATYNLRTNDLHYHEPNSLFQHPAVLHMPYFLFATSCSIQAPLFAEDVMTASNLKTIYLDYSRGGYFPDKKTEKNYTFGMFLQTVGLKYGKGRVLAFSDSTCFSNFYMHIPGKPEYILGTVNWLNRKNVYDKPVKTVCLVLMLAAGVVLIMVMVSGSRDRRGAVNVIDGVMLVCILLGLSLGVLATQYVAGQAYALPQANKEMKKVGFDQAVSDFAIPNRKLLHEDAIDYHTFYVWTQRLGYIPTLVNIRDDALDEYNIIVMVNPRKTISETALERIERYVNNGGSLLIVDRPSGKAAETSQLLKRFGLRIDYDGRGKDMAVFNGSSKQGTLPLAAPVKGGNGLLFTEDRQALVAYKTQGKGMIAVAACSPSFTVKHMGETETVPDMQQRFLYKLEFWLMEGLMNRKFSPFAETDNSTQAPG